MQCGSKTTPPPRPWRLPHHWKHSPALNPIYLTSTSGGRVLVYDMSNSKLGGRAKEGRWVEFKTESKASCVYWLDKHTVSIKHDTKFEQDHILVQPAKPPLDPAPAKTTTQTSNLNHPPQWRLKQSHQPTTITQHPGEVHRPSTPPTISSTYVPVRGTPLGMGQASNMGGHLHCQSH